jgi:kynurenine formamidase
VNPLQLIDLTHPIHSGLPVYPGDDPVYLQQTRELAKHKHVNHRLVTGMHSGTHVDGPAHLLSSSIRIKDLPLDRFCGRGCLLDVRGQTTIDWRDEYAVLMRPGDIVLLYTGWDLRFHEESYFTDHPVVTEAFAEQLVTHQVKMLGADTAAPDRPPFPVHKRLLRQGILILENLTNLQALPSVPWFEVMAFPLPLQADSSLVRVVARVEL